MLVILQFPLFLWFRLVSSCLNVLKKIKRATVEESIEDEDGNVDGGGIGDDRIQCKDKQKTTITKTRE